MRPWDEEEYRRYQGMPADHQPQADPGGADIRWVLHPLAWFRWRATVRRQGPYAPDFGDFRRSRKGTGSTARHSDAGDA
jgi:hypothetical protein